MVSGRCVENRYSIRTYITSRNLNLFEAACKCGIYQNKSHEVKGNQECGNIYNATLYSFLCKLGS